MDMDGYPFRERHIHIHLDLVKSYPYPSSWISMDNGYPWIIITCPKKMDVGAL